MVSFATARRMMVDGQIRTNDVTDSRILAAMGEVPRERFVPAGQEDLAYLDRDLPLTAGTPGEPPRCLLKSMVLAKMIQALEVGPESRVLVVGSGTGYGAAVLARLAGSVVALEEDAALVAAAERIYAELGLANVVLRQGPLRDGAPGDGPFDAILIEGAIERLPEALGAQLKEGGLLVCVLRRGPMGKALLYRSVAGELSGRPLFDAAAPLLPGFAEPSAFVF